MLRLRPFAAFICLALVLCLIGLWNARSQSGGLRRVTNTTEEGFNTNPSLSGDGSRIAFESSKDLTGGGGSNFPRAFRADVGSATIAFLQMAAARAPAPGISQDGSVIAFAARENPLSTNPDGNSEIFLFDGLALRQITNTTPATPSDRTRHGNFLPSLSDNGRFIAFSSNRNPAGQNGDGNFEIFIFDTLLNSFTQLTNTTGAVGATDAKISGDGSRVAYVRDNGALPAVQRDLVLQDRVGGATQVLVSGATNLALTYGRAISDDATRVVYSGETAANASQLFLFDGRRNSVRQLISLGAREDDVPLHPSISGDGLRISFATRRAITALGGNTDNSIELYTYDIPTGQLARVTDAPTNADCFDGSNRACEVVSSLNDDGSIVAFNFPRSLSGTVTPGTENNTEIYITGTAPRPVTGSLNVVNGASFGNEPATTEAVAPDSIAVAFGGALSFETIEATRQADGSFPRALGGTTVRVNGRLAQIFFVSPTRIHFHVPAETELGTAEVVITNEEGFRSVGTITVRSAAPGIFTSTDGQFTLFDDGRGPGVIMNADTFTRGSFDPTGGNLRLVIFTTGVRKASQVTAAAGGRALTVESFLPSPDLPGLDEVRVLVPADLRGIGMVDLVIRADDRDSNPVQVTFSGGLRDIVINEVLADPPDGPPGDANGDGTRSGSDDEFVELVNTSAINIDISGYQLFTRSTTSNDSLRHTFAPGTIFPAGSAIVVFGGGMPEQTNPAFGGAQIFTASSGGLSLINAGGVVTLREPSQAIAAIFSYGGTTGLNGDANQSLTRAPDITGDFVLHSQAPGGNGNPFSPGTRINGNPFASGQGRLTRITISPPSVSISVGQTTQFTAQAFDQFDRPLRNVTITFASDNTNVASVDAVTMDASTGIATGGVTGRGVGTAHITAQATDGTTTVTSSQATLTVNPVPAVVTRVEVSPANPTINRGQTQQFTATAFDQNNQPIAAATFTWSSSNTNVATINANGLATGVGLGSVTITATTFDATGAVISGTATLAVQVPLVLNEIHADVATDDAATTPIEGDANRDGVRNSDDDEFVELLNNSNAPVDISGVIIADGTSNRFTVPANTTLSAGRALVVFGGGTPPVSDPAFGGALIFTTSSLGLNDTGDTVNVKLNFGGADHPITSITYGGTGNPPAPSDQSLTRSPDVEIGTTGGNFVAHNTATNAAGRTFSPGTRANGTPFGSPPITRIEVSPASATIDVGATQVFTARAFSNTSGSEIEVQNVSFIWDSSDTTMASVAPTTGVSTTATGLAAGTPTIRARAGGQQGTAALTVNAPPFTYSVTGQVKDSANNPLSGVLITFELNFQGTLSTRTTQTDVNGNYSSGDLGCQNNVKVTPSKAGFTFTPSDITFTSTQCLSGSDTANFTGTPAPSSSTVVISQVYGGGGNAGAPFTHDFIEIFNRGTAAVDLTGWSVQYLGATGTGTWSVTNLSGTLQPGRYYLVQEASNAAIGSPLPTPDATGTIVMAATAGKVALVNTTTALSGACPTGAGIIDLVGYGTTANCFEGSAPAPAPSATTADFRKSGGCIDTNDNAADFATGAPNPRNSSSPLNDCSAVVTPNISINDVTVTEGNAGTVTATFTVSLSSPAPSGGVSFNIATQDNTATVANNDYVAKSLTGQNIPTGQQTYTFDVTVNGDTAVEADETFFVNLTNVVGATVTDGQGQGTIQNDDTSPLPTLTINDVTQNEGNTGTTTFAFTVSLSAPAPTGGVTFDIATADGTAQDDNPATEDNDYVAQSLTTQTIPAGQQTYTFNVAVNGDTNVEANETFSVNVTNVSGANVTDGQGVGTINNDDSAPPPVGNLVISQVYGGGGNAGAPFTHDFIEIFNRGTTPVDVTGWSVQYNSAAGTGAFQVTPICPTGPCLIQPGKYFLVQEASTAAIGSPLPTPDATGTIAMAATAGRVALVASTTPIPSNATCAQQLAAAVDFVGYGTAATCFEGSGPAPAPSATNADLRAGNGCVDTNDNAADFATGAPNPRNSGSPLNDCSAVPPTPNLTITDVTQNEGNAGTTTFSFTVNLSAPAPAGGVTFDIATADGTAQDDNPAATEDNDYVARSLTGQTIPAGQQSYTFDVTVNGDTVVEPNETFFVNVTNVSSANVTDGQGQGTIQNDDSSPTPSLTVTDVSLNEGNTGTTTFTFTVNLSAPAPAGGVTFDIATADGTAQDDNPATEDNDYVARSLTAQTIPATQTSFNFDVTVNGDTVDEPNETFFVNVTNVSGATIGDGQGLGTIQNDDAALPTFAEDEVVINEFVVNPTTGKEYVELLVTKPGGVDMRGWMLSDVNTRTGSTSGTEGDITLPSAAYLSNVPQGTLVVVVVNTPALNSNTLIEDIDTTDGNRRLVLITGTTTGLVTAGTFDISGDENIQLYAPGGRATARVVDQVLAGGSTAYIFAPDGTTVQATWGDNSTATTSDNINGGSAVPGNSNISFCPTADTLAEFQTNDTGTRFTRTASSYGTPGARNSCVASDTSIGGTGSLPTLSISDAVAVTEGNTGTTTTATFTVTLSASSTDTVTVQYETLDVTATAGSDYVAIPLTTLTFDPGQTSKTIDVTVNGDALDEINETFNVNLSNPSNATILDGLGVGTITDDDAPPTISINDPTAVTEGTQGTTTTITFNVTLSAASGNSITVNYATANGTAVAGATAGTGDYDATNGTLTFNPGITSLPVTVTVNGDNRDEPDTETFNVVLTSPTNATLLDDTGAGTITDDDPLPSLAINDPAAVTEGNTGTKTITFTVTLTGATDRQVTVNFATADNTATTADLDYAVTSGTLTFNPGVTSQTFDVTINGDANIEPDETFFVNLTLPSGSPATISDAQGVGTIANDDSTTPTFFIESKAVTEGTGADTVVNYRVTLSPASATAVTVNYTIASGTATVGVTGALGVDATAASLTGTLTFNPGDPTFQDIPVTIIGDNFDEPDETFTITLSGATGGAAISASQGTGTETITDDDATPTVAISDATVTEGNSGTTTADFTVTLTGVSNQTITINYTTGDVTATAGTDYVAITNGTVIYNPGETGTRQIQVTVNGDTLVEPNETFNVNLSSSSTVIITDSQGVGTITNDDVTPLVISQIYGGGGNTGAPFNCDYVELFNRGTSTIDFAVTPFSVQYASAAGNFGSSASGNKTDLTTGTVAPGKYFLVKGRCGANGAAFTADFTPATTSSGLDMATGAGKVALVSGVDPLTAATCPTDTTIVDLVGYGTTASCFEGTGRAPAHSNTTADFRKSGGCIDTNDNAADFLVAAPFPRNSGSPANNCIAGTPPDLTINDVTVVEGNAGTITATFTVSLSAPAPSTDVTFDIATQNDTATTADNDYESRSLTNQVIPAGQQTFTFSVTVNGDTTVEADETFFVNVTNVSGANLTDGQGQGTIQNDDSSSLPTLTITDVTQNEGNGGTTTFTFTVSLSSAAPAGGVTFDIATADGTAQDDNPATEDNDYVARSLMAQTIPATQTSFTFDVTVNGDTVDEPNETFFVNVTNVSGATLTDGQGQGTIQNDDAAATSQPVISQIYAGGGNGGAQFRNDFVEIFNRSSVAVDVSNWSIQTATATGTTWTITRLCPVAQTCTIPANGYYLVQLGSGGAVGTLLTPDATGTVNLAVTGGKVALVNQNTTALSGSAAGTTPLGGATCPTTNLADVIDFVGYGSATCFEGSNPAPALSNTTANLRLNNGCTDTNNNTADFTTPAPAPNPRNSTTGGTNTCP